MEYQYEITPQAVEKIIEFYAHVVLKYQHTFSLDDMERHVHQAIFNGYKIEQTLLGRRPAIQKWQGLQMAKAGKWYYAYSISGNTIIIEDACHQQNMHD